jgi:hypothetical protein
MSREPGCEQNWYPISKLGWFTGHIREGVEATRRIKMTRSQGSPALSNAFRVAPFGNTQSAWDEDAE